jgi:hypothetical protein
MRDIIIIRREKTLWRMSTSMKMTTTITTTITMLALSQPGRYD